jgi:hypothetical protein
MYPTCITISFMALPLPGERPLPLAEVFLAALAVLGLCALGCATPTRTRRLPSSVFQASRTDLRGDHHAPARGLRRTAAHEARGEAHGEAHGEGAELVEHTLHAAGLRFGTDGSTRALWGYMRTSHQVVSAADARPGDVLFFDTRGTAPEPGCADHAGIVETVYDDGRLGFVESRGGQIRHSLVDPERPTLRRDAGGQVLNTFLRPKLVSDPEGTRYFAGEMLCGIARVASR